VINWLRKRCPSSANENYTYTPSELKKTKEIESVFKRLDIDNSGTLDISEIQVLFRKNGIKIPSIYLKEFFKLVDKDGSGSVSIDELKLLVLNHDSA
jgi:Ca2+-binding EF-hand superfamily protein